jgi:hypothetical protein
MRVLLKARVFAAHPGETLKTESMEPMDVSAYQLAKALSFPGIYESRALPKQPSTEALGLIMLPLRGAVADITRGKTTRQRPSTRLVASVHPEEIYDAISRIQQNDSATQDYSRPIAWQPGQASCAHAGERLHAFLQAGRQGSVSSQLTFQTGW